MVGGLGVLVGGNDEVILGLWLATLAYFTRNNRLYLLARKS